MFNMQQMTDIMWNAFARQTDAWDPKYKQILLNTQVDVIRETEQLRIRVKTPSDTPDDDKVKEFLLKMASDPVARILGGLKCQVRKFE